MDEVRMAIFQMGANRAPGQMGYLRFSSRKIGVLLVIVCVSLSLKLLKRGHFRLR